MPESKLTAEFERVILPHLNSAYNLARWLLRSEQDAQDVVHDAFLRAHRYFGSFDGTDGRAWLLGIVRNGCFSFLRASKVSPLPQSEDLDLQTSAEPSPERELMLKEDLQALRIVSKHCPPSIAKRWFSGSWKSCLIKRFQLRQVLLWARSCRV